ncbi:5'/3'-nucleotidase SurE [Sphingopyxis sp. KK2]|uniref:5'/3'-nucleotidase SurE n=1 Tax=Sphingopyxis sp. KK2 TaxID=1855727 RepID=UPI00097E6168|nr:5'/3'-nucleotidase SurE [Sphingopyxis sp. KK2]
MTFRLTLLAAAMLASASPASARNIVIGNDDGLTANVKALYDALKAEGHDVIVAVPCSQQSGMGGALKFLQPLGPLAADCVAGAAKAGDPGAGPMTRAGLGKDFYYVDGTPVMAMLYGVDVVANERWGKAPDLVLSGPNIGQNSGSIVVSSGTVSVAQYAMMRAIPAIAFSAGENSASGADLVNPLSTLVAKRSLELIDKLEAASHGAALLPAGTGLNVNFPDAPEVAAWKLAKIGTYMKYDLKFVADLPAAMGKPSAAGQPPLPGLFARVSDQAPAPGEEGDEAVVATKDIAVSVIQVAYDAPAGERTDIAKMLDGLVK